MTSKSCILWLGLGFVLDVLTVENLTVTIAVCIEHLLSLVTGQFSFMQRRPSSCVAADGVEQYEKHSWRHRGDTESCTLAPSYLATDQGDPCSQILKRHLGVAVGFWYWWQDPYWIEEFLPCDSSWPCWWVQHGWAVASYIDLEEYIDARLGWRLKQDFF